jgi:inner membrane protein
MRWVSHILIAGAVCAVFNPIAVPAAVLGSTAPDWFEFILRWRQNNRVRHRGITHYLAAWLLAALAAHFVWDFRGMGYWFAVGGAIHWVCDALTVSGAPLGWWSDRRMTLFGGKIYTGGVGEYVITGLIVAACAGIIWSRQTTANGFIPFFYHWGEYYNKGLIDGTEWKANRFNVI